MNRERRFPNETPEYRTAREGLLRSEMELRDAVERVAAQRRKLPIGGKLKEDYAFEELADGATRTVKLSELFPKGKDTLFLYSLMYGPKAENPCPMCTSLLDGLNRQSGHITQRIGFAVVAKSPIARIAAFAKSRDWDQLRLVSAHGTTYQTDYLGEDEKGNQWPMANVFVRRPEGIHHFWGSEMLYAERKDGADTRHVEMLWPLWNVLDLTPDGRGADFYPKLRY